MARPKKEAPVVEASDYQMFSEVDINAGGKVGSYMPAWAYSQLIGDLREDISKDERDIEQANISMDKINELKKSVKVKKERLDEIESSRPKVNVDKVRDMTDGLGDEIASSMFSHTDMMRGTADAHTEARRMSEPCIKLTDEQCNFAIGCNIIPNTDKMVSRNQAAKVWKIGRRYLGQNSNIEILRKG